MNTRWLAILALVLVAVGCASQPKQPDAAPSMLEAIQCGSMARVHTLGDIMLGSQPSREDFALAKDAGVRTVLNFRHKSELPPDFDEQAEVERLGMTYIHLPWSGEAQLTDEVFDKGREIMRSAERPILVHCASSNRVGAIYLVWRVLDEGTPFDQALEEAQRVGMKTPAFERLAKAYIAAKGK